MMCFYVNPQSRSLFQSPATLNLLDEFFSVRQLGSLIRRFKALSTVVDTSDTFTQQLVFLSLGMKLLCLLAALINVLQYSCEHHRKTFPSLQCFTFSTHNTVQFIKINVSTLMITKQSICFCTNIKKY